MRARKAEEVLDAARLVFLKRGFDSATVEEVATEAGVSKATVYSNFHDKQALLAAMVDRVTAGSSAILASAVAPLDGDGTLQERFTQVGLALARGVLPPQVVQLRRLAISTAMEFPASAALYWQRGPAATIEMLAERLTAMVAAGKVTCPNPRSTATLFAYALIGPLQDRVMFEAGYVPSPDEIGEHVDRAVGMLLASLLCESPDPSDFW
ncbi:TetR/AcrR family transcriptional regulator [soil metagenome]